MFYPKGIEHQWFLNGRHGLWTLYPRKEAVPPAMATSSCQGHTQFRDLAYVWHHLGFWGNLLAQEKKFQFWAWLCHGFAVWPRAHPLPLLGLSLSICSVGMVIPAYLWMWACFMNSKAPVGEGWPERSGDTYTVGFYLETREQLGSEPQDTLSLPQPLGVSKAGS